MGGDPVADQNQGNPQQDPEPSVGADGSSNDGGSNHEGDFAASDLAVTVNADEGSQAATDAALHPEPDMIPFVGDNAEGAVGAACAGTGDLLADNDVLAAVTSMHTDAMFNVDHTLDQLTTSSDLFDVPAMDFHDVLPS